MQLYVVRHGETQANVQGRYQGSLNAPLNQNRIAQAQGLRSELPGHIDLVVVSPLRRAQQTARIIFANDDVAMHTREAFRERSVGVFEGLTQQEARERYPDLWAQNITRQWTRAPTEGESIVDVVERVGAGLNMLMADESHQVIVLVAHGFVAKAIRALVRHDFSDFFDWQLSNGEVLAFDVDIKVAVVCDAYMR